MKIYKSIVVGVYSLLMLGMSIYLISTDLALGILSGVLLLAALAFGIGAWYEEKRKRERTIPDDE